MTCNGYLTGEGTTWDLLLEASVRTFQKNMCIPETGKGRFKYMDVITA